MFRAIGGVIYNWCAAPFEKPYWGKDTMHDSNLSSPWHDMLNYSHSVDYNYPLDLFSVYTKLKTGTNDPATEDGPRLARRKQKIVGRWHSWATYRQLCI